MTLTAKWNKCDHKTSTNQPTCTDAVTCTVCGGTIPAPGHTWSEWTPSSNNTHTRTCTVDKFVERKACADPDKDHKCDYCGATLSQCADANKDHICDYCGKTISNHADTDKNHICDYCGKTISNHEDADKDHNCDLCGKVLTVHTGGTATCIAPAVCELCGQSYGDIDPAVHADLRHIPAKAATTEAVGNIEYWYCAGCNKYYQDAAAKLQITRADTVTPQRIPHHYSGPTIMVVGTSYYDGGNTGLTFISSAAYSGFKGVQVDGETLAAKSYTSRENGGSQVYLKPDYLRSLTNGDHIVTILSAEGDVAAVFTVSVPRPRARRRGTPKASLV